MQLLEEAKGIRGHDKGLLDEVKRTILEILPSATVILYGSSARGCAGPDSDYDIYVLTDEDLSSEWQERVWDAVFELEMRRDAVISVQFCSRAEWERHAEMPFHVEVRRDGIVL
jgi:predicted nucleotidyltransferase